MLARGRDLLRHGCSEGETDWGRRCDSAVSVHGHLWQHLAYDVLGISYIRYDRPVLQIRFREEAEMLTRFYN